MALLQGNDAFEYQKYVDRYSDHSTIYNGHEILDKKQYVYDPLELNPQAYFNHKRPVIHTPGGSPIPEKGKISWDDGISIHEFPLNVLFPSLYIRSFYGAIKGDRYPSRDQQNVFYRISKNIIDNQTAEGIYQLEYTFEDELGFLTKDVVNLSNSNDRRIIVGSKIGANFNIQGGGYHEITLTYRRNADASSVIIAGKELRVVDLRFVSAPGTKEAGDFAKDGSIFIANDALDLKEGRGDGKNWYLRERVAQTAADVNGYGDTDYGVTRTYVLAKGDRVVFNAIDADPHTFRHYDVEWYLSQRLMSKCLTDEELESRIAWTLSGPSQANGTGRHYAHTFETAGEYTLEATYGGTSTVKHKIIVHEAPYVNTPESEKGKIVFYDLSDVQKEWLREFTGSPDLDLSEAKVAKVQDIYSKYSYDEGPRAPGNNPENRENRYGPQNDFNASFAWTVPKCVNLYYIGNMVLDAVEQCTLDNQPEFFPDPYLDEFEPASSWFPKDWIRHFSDKPYPNDINSGLITDPESAVSSHWPEDVFEPWMWRLPWISRTQWHGYRTRWNIKAVYDMKRLFNDDLGAFSGEKFHLTDNPDAYRREVYGQPVSGGGYDGTKIVAGLDDTARKKYDFFWDLYAGRKLIIDATELHGPEHRRFEVRLINPADDNFTFIAAKIYGDPPGFLKGADMSSIKTQEAEGISWSFGGKQVDPYTLLGDFGANVVRFRVWLDPKYTVPGNPTWPGAIPNEFAGQPFPYNTVATVKDEIVRAKEQGLKVILDFHYSDTWTDPERNLVPTDWQTAIGDQTAMGDNLAVYTKTSLDYLNGFGALPDFVQIGNEINSNLLLSKPYEEMTLSEVATELGVSENQLNGSQFTINWDRNADLLNRGLSAVKDNYSQIQTILHVSGVATCTWWADQAFNENASNRLGTTVVNKNKVDIMAMSYYPGEKFSEANLTQLQNEITTIHEAHGVQVLVVETAYPASTKNSDYVNNLMGHYCEDIASSCNGDPYAVAGDQPCACIQWPENPTPKVQKDWLLSLKETLVNTPGAAGFVYWEPFWVGSKSAKSKDFKGSNWENMSFFQYEEGQAVDVNPLELNGGIQVFCDGPCPISPPLVRHLFDNNYEDASGNNISSVPQNNPGFVSNTAQGSRALLLSQTNYVDLDVNNAFIHDAFNERTVAFWVYSAQNIASITEDLYDEGGATHGIAIRKQGTTLELAVRNNRQQRTISSCFYRDEWIHVAGVFDNGKLQLYINGQLQAENPDVGYSSIPAHGNGAGFGKTNGENAFDQVSVGLFGLMDDLQVYGRALTADEVQYLVAQADITPDPDLCGANSALSGSGGSSQVGEIGIVSLDVPANESLKVYPNPSADGNFVVTFDLPASATVGLEVSALDGRRLMTKSLNKLVAGQHRLQIEETQGLPPGMYLLKVDFGDHVEARKLVISN
jgi:arabinogalactan endo-1,4-beta-galactosidase